MKLIKNLENIKESDTNKNLEKTTGIIYNSIDVNPENKKLNANQKLKIITGGVACVGILYGIQMTAILGKSFDEIKEYIRKRENLEY